MNKPHFYRTFFLTDWRHMRHKITIEISSIYWNALLWIFSNLVPTTDRSFCRKRLSTFEKSLIQYIVKQCNLLSREAMNIEFSDQFSLYTLYTGKVFTELSFIIIIIIIIIIISIITIIIVLHLAFQFILVFYISIFRGKTYTSIC